jgi:hypothetical protein
MFLENKMFGGDGVNWTKHKFKIANGQNYFFAAPQIKVTVSMNRSMLVAAFWLRKEKEITGRKRVRLFLQPKTALIWTHRYTRFENPGDGVVEVFAKIPGGGGGQGFRDAMGGPLFWVLLHFYYQVFHPSTPPPPQCASMFKPPNA